MFVTIEGLSFWAVNILLLLYKLARKASSNADVRTELFCKEIIDILLRAFLEDLFESILIRLL